MGRAVGAAAGHHRPRHVLLRSATPDLTPDNVLRFMVLDATNPGSASTRSMQAARENARAHARRDHLRDVGEPQRHLAGDAQPHRSTALQARGISDFFDWVKTRSRTCSAASPSAPCCATRPTASSASAPSSSAPTTPRACSTSSTTRCCPVGGRRRRRGRLLPVERAAALGVSAFESYRKIYRDVITPIRVAETADPARRRAALAARLHERDLRHPAGAVRRRRGCEPERLAGEIARAAALRHASSRSSSRACTST